MSKKSEHVKEWRKRTKLMIVESMGGECQICKYSKCQNALELHHIESDDKEFDFGSVRANIQSWAKIVNELRKCVLLCVNCHREVHNDLTPLPASYKSFDESYLDYKKVSPAHKYDSCICGTKKLIQNLYCSHKCASKARYKVDWDSLDLLSLLIEHKSYIKVGELLGVSGAAVRKRALKQNITRNMFV